MSPLLRKDDRVGEGERWAVVRKIGDGGFAEVYEVRDTLNDDAQVALKLDKLDKRQDPRGGTVKTEHKVLRQLQACKQVCRLVPDGEGIWDGRSFLLMELLGLNLTQYMRAHPHNGRLHASEAKRIGAILLNALEGIHRLGWLHRDVKPANFAQYQGPGASGLSDWRVIDFGIARRYTDEATGQVLPRRQGYGEFRGSTTYASIHAHLKQDLGRRDDLWSWLYIVVEMLEGSLPWRAKAGSPGQGNRGSTAGHSAGSAGSEESPRELAQRLKQQCMQQPHSLAASGDLPDGLVLISGYLQSLRFEDEPNYEMLRTLLASIREHAPVLAPMPLPAMPAHPPQHTPQQQQQPQPPPPPQQQQQWQVPVVNGLIRQQSGAMSAAALPQPAAPPWPHYQQQQQPYQHRQHAQPHAAQPPAGVAYATPPAHSRAPMGNGHLPRPVTLKPPVTLQSPQIMVNYAEMSFGGPPQQPPAHAAAAQRPRTPAVQQHYPGAWQPQQQQRHAANDGRHGSAPPLANGTHGVRHDWPRSWSGQLAAPYSSTPSPAATHVGGLLNPSPMHAELGQIGSEFEPQSETHASEEHYHHWEGHSSGRKHARDDGQHLLEDGQAVEGKRARMADAATPCERGGAASMAVMAAVVAQGRVSEAALEVKEKLRGLAPAEGVAVLAWLVDSLPKHVDPAGRAHVGQWLSSLASFTDDCADRCSAAPPP